VGRSPAWSDPWGRTTICEVVRAGEHSTGLVAVAGEPPGSGEIYEARLEERDLVHDRIATAERWAVN
jgi:hypothetical protein